MILKDDPKWKINNPLQCLSKKIRIDESEAYTSSSNSDTSIDIDDNKIKIHSIGKKKVAKGKSKVNEEKKNTELHEIQNMLEGKYNKKIQAMDNLANKLHNYNF